MFCYCYPPRSFRKWQTTSPRDANKACKWFLNEIMRHYLIMKESGTYRLSLYSTSNLHYIPPYIRCTYHIVSKSLCKEFFIQIISYGPNCSSVVHRVQRIRITTASCWTSSSKTNENKWWELMKKTNGISRE